MYKKTQIAVAVSAALTFSGLAFAESETFTFDEVVVSATRTEQNTKDVASSVTKVSAEDLDKEMSGDIKQALKSDPAVNVEGNGRFGYSGINIRGREANYVKVMIDGVQQASIYNPGADVMRKNQNAFETDTLTLVEVTKGPASSLYGSDALAGVVYMRTKEPADLLKEQGDDTYISLKSGYASVDDSFKNTVTLANRTGAWETILMYTYKDGHETKTHSSGADINGRDRGAADPFDIQSDNILGKVFYQANEAHRFGLTAEIYNSEADGKVLSNEGYTIMPGYTYTQNTAYDEDQRQRYSLEHKWQANNSAFDQLEWMLSWQQSYEDHNTYDHTDANGYRNRQRNGEDTSTQFNAQFDKAFELENSYHELTYGATFLKNKFELEYTNFYYDQDRVDNVDGEVPSATSETWGVFVQDQGFYLDDRLVINLGLRYDSFNADPKDSEYRKSNNDAWTARGGAVYHLTDETSVFGQVSQGFKAPTIYDLYYSYDGHSYSLEANPDLKPEESIAYETGVRFANQNMMVEVRGFYNDYKNFIENKIVGQDSNEYDVYQNQNIAKAEIYGVELATKYALDNAIGLPMGSYSEFNVAYAKGKDKESGDAIDTVAPLSGYFALGYDETSGLYGMQLAIQMAASKSGNDWSSEDNVNVAGYAVTDITGYYRPINDLTLRAGLFNAFDKKYWLYSNVDGFEKGDEGLDRRTEPGRNWGVNMEYVF